MADDLSSRRAKLFGAPQTGPAPEVLALLTTVNEAHTANAELAQALRATVKDLTATIKAEQAEESAEIARLKGECSSWMERCITAETELARCQERAAAADEALAFERSRPAPQMPEMPVMPAMPVIDTSAIAAAVIAALPQPSAAVPPKAWSLDTKDSMGNPRRVRITPEY